MHHFGSTVVPFTPRLHPDAGLATVVGILTAEPQLHTGGIALSLACQLAQLHQRVLLIDLDENNDVATICGFADLALADRRGMTSTSCIATNRPLSPHITANFASVAMLPTGLMGAAAAERLRKLCSEPTGVTIVSAASLHLLRHQYDFILIDAPPMFTPYRLQNLLADFALWKTDAVLVPHQPADSSCRGRLAQCAQFIRSARLSHGNHLPCEIWLLPLDKYADAALLMRSQAHFAPHHALRLPVLQYQTLLQKLKPLYDPAIEMPTRIADVRGASKLLDNAAQKCVLLRG